MGIMRHGNRGKLKPRAPRMIDRFVALLSQRPCMSTLDIAAELYGVEITSLNYQQYRDRVRQLARRARMRGYPVESHHRKAYRLKPLD